MKAMNDLFLHFLQDTSLALPYQDQSEAAGLPGG